jgi:hypothetical protein
MVDVYLFCMLLSLESGDHFLNWRRGMLIMQPVLPQTIFPQKEASTQIARKCKIEECEVLSYATT